MFCCEGVSAVACLLNRSASASLPNPVAEDVSMSRRLVTGVNWLQQCELLGKGTS